MPFDSLNNCRYYYEIQGKGSAILFLHGFTGSSENWKPISQVLAKDFKIIMPDLLGHGRSDSPLDFQRYTIEAIARDMMALLDHLNIETVKLVGYSMGGRLALYIALHYPQRIQQLILESSSPGLREAQEREARQQKDTELAHFILANPIEVFTNYWESLDLWKSQEGLNPEAVMHLRQIRLKNHQTGLANSLLGMGTGVQPSLWEDLGALPMPVALIVGGFDKKFSGINESMCQMIRDCELYRVEKAGHTVHLEQRAIYLSILSKLFRRE